MIDQSMVMAKTGLEVWLDLLGAIGRLDGNCFFIGWARWAFSWCHPNHSPLHLLLLQPLTLLLLLPLHQRLVGRMAPGRLYGGSHSVHCTVLCVHCTAPPPPLVPLLDHGGDLQPAAFIHRYTTRARPGTAHLYRLALCLKQGFGEGHRRTFPRDFLVFFLEEIIQKTTATGRGGLEANNFVLFTKL